jgi:hypothetical protein
LYFFVQIKINNIMVAALSSLEVLLYNSNLYREFTAEREEIHKHKWCMSEKEGRDVGFERALIDWVSNHRNNWKKTRI